MKLGWLILCPILAVTLVGCGSKTQINSTGQLIESKNEIVPEKPAMQEVKILFVGDMMFDRDVRRIYEGHSEDAFTNVKELFETADLTIANLEGPIVAGTPPLNLAEDNLTFAFLSEVAPALKAGSIDIVSLANNHTGNQGKEGLESTRRFLDEQKLSYFGSPSGFNPETDVKDIEIKNHKLTFLGVNTLQDFDRDVLIGTVSEKAKERQVFTFIHWGAEYQKNHNSSQEDLAHALADAGVTAVIGSHPHVIQDVETYNEVPIFYSLGNFLFDQWFSEETQKGLAVEITVDPKGKVSYQQHLIDLHDSNPRVAD